MAKVYSNLPSNTGAGTASLDNTRRKFNFGDRVAELAPQQSPFFVYLTKVAKKATNDPVFKFLEQRHQWQRRNFEVNVTLTTSDAYAHGAAFTAGDDLRVSCKYDEFGKIVSGSECRFIVPGCILAVKADSGTVYRMKVAETATVYSSDTLVQTAISLSHDEDGNHTEIAGEMLSTVGTTIPSGTVLQLAIRVK